MVPQWKISAISCAPSKVDDLLSKLSPDEMSELVFGFFFSMLSLRKRRSQFFLFFASLNAALGAEFWCGVVESLEDRLKKLRNSLSGIRIEPIN